MNQKDAEPGEDIEIVETNMHIRKSCFPIPRSEKEEEERQKKNNSQFERISLPVRVISQLQRFIHLKNTGYQIPEDCEEKSYFFFY